MSVATETKVFAVVLFDRSARVLFGCSAQDFFDFTKIHPLCGETASKTLEGEMLKVTLSKPKNGNAHHQRVVSVVHLKSGFRSLVGVSWTEEEHMKFLLGLQKTWKRRLAWNFKKLYDHKNTNSSCKPCSKVFHQTK